ncbi:hypothetical protein IE53DRAFT_328113 [Violaceomyces palustris]|uniref:Uncharacterized protein n=1 Tax=Violaceomyces palustris TaxID=1673888 RepID=A0ACD0P0S6_9BASI|nr:hypothetical protein IE53DRAFT_328113 [Violaceomyces palustris]
MVLLKKMMMRPNALSTSSGGGLARFSTLTNKVIRSVPPTRSSTPNPTPNSCSNLEGGSGGGRRLEGILPSSSSSNLRSFHTTLLRSGGESGGVAEESVKEWFERISSSKVPSVKDRTDLNRARQLKLCLPSLESLSLPSTERQGAWEKSKEEEVLSIEQGDPMPKGSELILFNPLLTESRLSQDGTESDFRPPGGFDQRMWASGSFHFNTGNPLLVAQEVESRTFLESAVEKKGKRTGDMVLVTRRIEISNPQGLVCTERRCHVYRKKKDVGTPPPQTDTKGPPAAPKKPSPTDPPQPDVTRTFLATRSTLFRYSAVTFNSHRIHLDPEYCRLQEGHKDCLVHGPLTATLLLNLASTARPNYAVQSFEYRALNPLLVDRPFSLNLKWSSDDGLDARLWATDEHGVVCMSASATLVPS